MLKKFPTVAAGMETSWLEIIWGKPHGFWAGIASVLLPVSSKLFNTGIIIRRRPCNIRILG
jgi:hypothetical protein